LAAPIILSTPSGLNPGDKFRFIFETSGTRNATSSDIADYNSFVNTQASGATYNGLTVNWAAIGSTATVNARDNVGGFGTLVPVYLVTGTKVANDLTTNADGLWGTTTTQSLLAAVNIDILGNSLVAQGVFTGTNPDGTRSGFSSLGDNTVSVGFNSMANYLWMNSTYLRPSSSSGFYALSSELTVPEPDSLALLAIGLVGMVAARRRGISKAS
jgi:hypothetical protein